MFHLLRYALPALGIIVVTAALSAKAQAGSLSITVENIQHDSGQVMLALCQSKAAFDGEEPAIASFMQAPNGESLTISTTALPPGEYGIRVMHDVDGDGEMGSNMLGMPTEPWAFSNNATGNFGPPTWEDIVFTIDDDATQTIRLVQ